MTDAEHKLLQAESLLDERHLAHALAAFDEAAQLGASPDRCSAGRWMCYMLLGRFEQAWRQSDAIRRRGAPDSTRFWNGEEIDGNDVIVRCLHGFGDSVQFLRYMPALRRRARRVTLETAPHMALLAQSIDGVDEVITWGPAAPRVEPHWDVQIEVTELPYVFRTQIADLPIATEYLHIAHEIRHHAERAWCAVTQPRVGVVWSSGEWNLARSIPLDLLTPVLKTQGVAFCNLQGGTVREQWCLLTCSSDLHDYPAWCADAGLLPLAGFIAQLDLVITVDTLAAHLGGALGVPTWVMLQHAADWRWMHERSDSPWYPSMRLFRQPAPGDWRGAVRNVQSALNAWLHHAELRQQVA